MNTEPTPESPFFTQPVDELAEYLRGISAMQVSMAQALVDAIDTASAIAALAAANDQRFQTMAEITREMLQWMQAVTSGEDMTPEWLAQRDAYATQASKLLDDNDASFPGKTEKGTTSP